MLMIPFHVDRSRRRAERERPGGVDDADVWCRSRICSDISRQVTVLAYQTGAGLTELLTPTNGGLMAVLLAAGVPYSRWIRFAVIGVLLALSVGVVGMIAAMGCDRGGPSTGRVLSDYRQIISVLSTG